MKREIVPEAFRVRPLRPAWAGVGTHTLIIYSHAMTARSVDEREGRERIGTTEAFVAGDGHAAHNNPCAPVALRE